MPNCGENYNAAYKGCIKYRTIDRALNISVKQGISYRDAVTQVKKTYTEEKTRSTSTSSDITEQTERVQGAKKVTSAVASGTKTIKSVPARKNADRTDDNTRKETSAKAAPTLVSEANKSTSGNTSTPSTAGDQLRDQMLCLITTTATALFWVVRNIPPTSGQLQVINQLNAVLGIIKKLKKMKTAKQSAVVEVSTQQQETTTPTAHGRRGAPNDVNDANDDVNAGPQPQAVTQ